MFDFMPFVPEEIATPLTVKWAEGRITELYIYFLLLLSHIGVLRDNFLIYNGGFCKHDTLLCKIKLRSIIIC